MKPIIIEWVLLFSLFLKVYSKKEKKNILHLLGAIGEKQRTKSNNHFLLIINKRYRHFIFFFFNTVVSDNTGEKSF